MQCQESCKRINHTRPTAHLVKPKLGAAVHTNISYPAMYRYNSDFAFEFGPFQIFGWNPPSALHL